MVHKMYVKYSNADIFLFTLPNETYYGNTALRFQYNQIIRKIANYFNFGVVDLAEMSDYSVNIDTNDGLHPNTTGMIKIANYVIKTLNNYYKLTPKK